MSTDNFKQILGIKINTDEGERYLLALLYTNSAWYDYDNKLVYFWGFIKAKNHSHLMTREEMILKLLIERNTAILDKSKEEAKAYLKDFTSCRGFKIKGKFVSFKSYENFIIKKGIDEALTLEQIRDFGHKDFASHIELMLESKDFNTTNFYMSPIELDDMKYHYYPTKTKKESSEKKEWVIEFEKGYFYSRSFKGIRYGYSPRGGKRYTLKRAKRVIKNLVERYPHYKWDILRLD